MIADAAGRNCSRVHAPVIGLVNSGEGAAICRINDRSGTAVVNAYVQPSSEHVSSLEQALRESELSQSAGSVTGPINRA